MNSTFLFLGTGASAGVPAIGCRCAVCTSESPKNQRLRSSGLLKIGGKQFLIDVGPDFRQQALRASVERLDGLLLTHTHYDHVAGIDELRIFNFRMKRPMPCLLSKETLADLERRYYYLFEPNTEGATMSAQIKAHLIEEEFGAVEFEGVSFGVLTYLQSGMKVNGFRCGDFAYVSDIRTFDEKQVFEALQGVKKLVLSALRRDPSPVQFNVDEAVAFAKRVGAETWLTHLSHSIDEGERLPDGIHLGYDGLEIKFTA